MKMQHCSRTLRFAKFALPDMLRGVRTCFGARKPPLPILRQAVPAAALTLLLAGTAHAQRLVVISSGDVPPYQQALAGIHRIAGITVDTLFVGSDSASTPTGTLSRLPRDTAVVALGTRASEFATRAKSPLPLVSCLSLTADAARSAPNVQIVPIDVPIDAQIEALRTFLPQARTIGILFDPAINAKRIETIATALATAGFQTRLAPVTSHEMLPQALANLPNAIDAILAIPDPTVYTEQASKALLLFSFRNRIPLIGLTEAWVRAGALYAVEWDYEELGAYCATLALRTLQPSKAPPPPLPRPRVAVNLRSAEQLHIKWNMSLLHDVDRSYE
jgi:putative ABC transport system substrate-binding protein